ncbi:MAG: DUF5688 family protein [Lachnospiraceae bacterium]|nr:DUF5688 family protein [Lachnospiraceae bacterium]
MDMKEFVEKVKKALGEYAGERCEIRISQVRKNNGILLTGISLFREESNITPTIYLDDYLARYEDGEPFGSLMNEVIKLLERSGEDKHFDVSSFLDWNRARERIAYRLVNAEKNRELLEEIPHMLYLDMAIVFYYLLGEGDFGNASILINLRHMEQWGVSKEALYSEAVANCRRLLPESLQSMEELMRDILLEDIKKKVKEIPEEESDAGESMEKLAEEMLESVMDGRGDVPMFVLTNRAKYYGAACMLYPGVLRSFAERLGKSLYILPSSIHELILLGDNGMEAPGKLRDMVRQVNETQVAADEVLSDSIYYYDLPTDELRRIREEEMAASA